MARLRNENLALPISPIRFTAKAITTMGVNSTPRAMAMAMDWQIIVMLEHHKYSWWCSNIAQFLLVFPPLRYLTHQLKNPHFSTLTVMNLAINWCASPSYHSLAILSPTASCPSPQIIFYSVRSHSPHPVRNGRQPLSLCDLLIKICFPFAIWGANFIVPTFY